LYLDKIELDGAILGNQVPLLLLLLVTLRRPIYFKYEIEFIDMNGAVLDTVEGEKGKASFSHTCKVYSNTDVMARFRIGNIAGPESEALTFTVETTSMLTISHTIMQIKLIL